MSPIRRVFLATCVAFGLYAQTLSQSGIIRSNQQPIPGVTITATNGSTRLTAITDEAGEYRIDKLTPGTWKFTLEAIGFQTATKEVELAAGAARQEWTLELALRRAAPQRLARGQGFQRLAVDRGQNVQEVDLQPELPVMEEQPQQTAAIGSNEAFLLNGSLSNNLEGSLQRGEMEGREAFLRGFGGGFPGGPEGPGLGGPGMGGPGSGGPGGPGGGAEGVRGPGGGGGPPGGAGPGGFRGGPPGGGGPGGFAGRGGPGGRPGGGPGARGGPPGRRPGGPGFRPEGAFGNRAGRGQQGIRTSLSFNLRNSALDARPYSLTGQTFEKAEYSSYRINLNLGGPLRFGKLINSPRTFFFVTYSGSLGRNPFNAISTLPGDALRTGDFTGRPAIYDPLSSLPFANNQIPASRINSAARGLLAFYPLPNQPGDVQNYQFVTSLNNYTNQLGVRVNRGIGSKDRIDVNVNFQFRDATNAQLLGFRDDSDGLGQSVSLGWTHNFNRSTIHSTRVNFSRSRSETIPFFAYKADVARQLGIEGVSSDPINYGPPNLTFTNFGALNDASPILRRDQTLGFTDSLLLVRGAHNITFGGGYRRMQLNQRTDQNARGTFNFSGLATSALDANRQPLAQTGFDFADFLLGLPQSSSVRFGGTNTYFRAGAWNGFAMDDYRIRSNLTLNLGVRYEFFTPFREKYRQMANLDLAPERNAVAVVTPGQAGPYSGIFPDGLIDTDKNNISPRIGIAWRPIPKKTLQIRMGYGIFHNGGIYNQFPMRLAAQPPFASTATINTSLSRTLTIQNGFATAPSQSITNSYAVDRAYRVGYAQTFSFNVQQSLPRNFILELGYLGTKGTRLDLQRLPNRAAPGSPLTAEQRRQIGNATGFTYDTSEGNSIYHSAQVRLTRRFARGIAGNLQYTFGKSLDNASTLGGGGATVAQNDNDLRAERGRSSFDQRHQLNLFYILTSPVRPNSTLFAGNPKLAAVLRNWTLSGGATVSSGTPLTARVLGNQADGGGTGATGSQRANATGQPLYAGAGFFNLAAFSIPPAGTFGNSSRNIIDGPRRFSLNAGFGRSFEIADRKNIELRMESQNLTNTVSFTNLGTVVNAINYGLPTNTSNMRTVSGSIRFRF